MKAMLRLVVAFAILTTSAGCWNSADIQTMAYAIALGIDYENGKYIGYVQIVNFSNIAKMESLEIGKPLKNWIGRGEGRTVSEALGNVIKTAQIRMFWGQVKTVILTERLMRHGVHQVYDALNRFREVRFTVTVYGTTEKIDTLFAQKSLLNYSPIDSLEVYPERSYAQYATVPPMYGFKFVSSLHEPGNSTLLPSLGLTRSAWKEDQDEKQMFIIDGVFLFNGFRYASRLPISDLAGVRWMLGTPKTTPLSIPEAGRAEATLQVLAPKRKITPLVRSDEVRYRIRVKVKAEIAEIAEIAKERNIGEFTRMAEETIRAEIVSTYRKALAKQCDIYRLSETLYRSYPHRWKREFGNDNFPLHPGSLEEVDVKVEIFSSGKYKLK